MCNKVINETLLNHPINQNFYDLFNPPVVPKEITYIYQKVIAAMHAVDPLSQFKYCETTRWDRTDHECISKSSEYSNYFLTKGVINSNQTSEFTIQEFLNSNPNYHEFNTENNNDTEYGNTFFLNCEQNTDNGLSWLIEFSRRFDFNDKTEIRYHANIRLDESGNLLSCSEEIESPSLNTTEQSCNLPLIKKFVTMEEETEKPAPEVPPKDEEPEPADSGPADPGKVSSTTMILGGLGVACFAYKAYQAAKKVFHSQKPENTKKISNEITHTNDPMTLKKSSTHP